MIRERYLRAFALFTVLFALVSAGYSQGTTTRITGIVTDSAGAPVLGATVKISRVGGGTNLTTQTADNGQYVFDLIPPGVYELTVEKTGFKRFVSTNISANLNLPATVNVSLEVGDVSATVTVEGASEQVQTSTSGNVGSTIDQRLVESLPIVGLRGRNPLDLLNYQPGVLVGANTGGGVHVHGSRDRAFNFTLDGVDINESTAGGSNFTPLRTNPDSIQEFQIITNNPTAEQGRSSGAQVTLVTKPGTNEFRGNLFEYYQTPRFNANEFENNLLNIPRRQFVQHIYGGSFGGPIPNFGIGEGENFKLLRNKAFFFVNLQKLSATETRLAQRTVYTQTARSGIFRYVFGGGTVNGLFVPGRNAPAGTPASSTNPLGASVTASGAPTYPACVGTPPTNAPCIASYNINTSSPITTDPFIVNLLNSYPLPNDFSRGDGLNTAGFNFNALQLEKQYDFVTRIDYKFSDSNSVYFRYAKGAQDTIGDSVNGGLAPFPGFPNAVNTLRRPENYAVNHRWAPTAKFTNEFIFGFSRFQFKFANEAPNPAVPFLLNSVTDAYSNFGYNARRARTIQFIDNVTLDFSPHLLKFGINFRFGRQVDDRSSVGAAAGIEGTVGFGAGSSSFVGFNLPAQAVAGTSANPGGTPGIFSSDRSLLQAQINNFLGRIGSYSQSFVVSPGNPNAFAPAGTRWAWTANYPELDFYFQDTWRMRSNFTVDLGLRYEIKLSPRSSGLPILRATQPYVVGAPPTNTLSWTEGPLFANDYNNYSPSIGFAWDPFGTGKTSVRMNYRLAYDRFPSQVFASSIFQSAPGNTTTAGGSAIGSLNLLLRDGLPNLFPTQTPAQLRTPPAFSTLSITVLDPDMQYPEVHQWFAGFQREIGFGSLLELNYIGKKGLHLFGGYDSNQVNIFARDPRCPENFLQAFNTLRASSTATSCLINLLFTGDPTNNAGTTTFRGIPAVQTTLALNNTGGSVATAALAVSQHVTGGVQTIGRPAPFFNNPFFFQRFPQYTGALNVLDTNDYSFYNGFEAILKRRMSKGVAFQIGYTLSKSKDTRSFDPTFTIVSRGSLQSASSTPFNVNDRKLNYAWSDFDRRHAIQATYTVELPIGRGRRYGSDISKALDYIIGGWQVAGTFNRASGRPFTIYSGLNTFSNVNQSFANCNGCSRKMGSLVERNGTWYWFTAEQEAMFSQPLPGELGNTGRNFFIAPRQFQTDMSLLKKFRFSERYSFDLRVDARNLTNSPTFGLPTAVQNSAVFGRIRDSVTSLARRIQWSGKFNF